MPASTRGQENAPQRESERTLRAEPAEHLGPRVQAADQPHRPDQEQAPRPTSTTVSALPPNRL